MAGTVLFPNDWPVNTLMKDSNFYAYCRLGKSEIARINAFHFFTQKRKNSVKSKETTKLAGLLHARLLEVFPIIYVFILVTNKLTRKYINLWFKKPTTGRNNSDDQKVNFESPVFIHTVAKLYY